MKEKVVKILNIGLTTRSGFELDPIEVVNEISQKSLKVIHLSIVEGQWEGKTEKTLVAYIFTQILDDLSKWALLAERLDQECIAMFTPRYASGRLIWSDDKLPKPFSFDKSKFKL